MGDTANLAARLQQIAEPGAILISDTTRRLVKGYVQLNALSPLRLKGIRNPVDAFELLSLSRPRSPLMEHGDRTLSELVGRARELADLENLLSRLERGEGHVVGIVGEAGLGKSRPVHEFRKRLKSKQLTFLEGRCLS